MATRPTSLELKQLNARTNQLQAQHDPGVFRLFRFLEAVWDYTKGVPCPEQTIYDLYCGKLPAREPNERAPAAALLNPVKAEFFAKAQRLHKACNGDTPLIPEDVVSVKNSNLEFRSPCHLAAITDRVYINVRMDHAVAVMRFIALEVVLGDRPCAVYAKIADPLELCVPLFDRIVIYCSSQAAAKLAARQVSGAFPDTCFNPGTPAMTEVLSPGICTGAEPRQEKTKRAGGMKIVEGKDQSFGTKRASVICAALRECNGNPEIFFTLVDRKFRESNIDPRKPHRNLPDDSAA